MGYIDRNPIHGFEKPEARRRTSIVTPEEFQTILRNIRDHAFRELPILSCDSGARPQEVKGLEARHIQLEKRRAVIPAEEAKGNRTRAIYFPTERSLEIVEKRMHQYPEGPILRNRNRRPWTANAVRCRFRRLQDKLGKRFRQYDFRHGFVTRKLLAGVDSHVVAALADHASTKTIDDVYSHVAEDHQFMLSAAQKDTTSEGG